MMIFNKPLKGVLEMWIYLKECVWIELFVAVPDALKHGEDYVKAKIGWKYFIC